MFDAKFELDSRFGDTASSPSKKKKKNKRTSWGCIDGMKHPQRRHVQACLRPATTMYIHFCSHTYEVAV